MGQMFLDIGNDIGMGNLLMLMHFPLFFMALTIWSFRHKTTDLMSKSFGLQAVILLPASGICCLMFLDDRMGLGAYIIMMGLSDGTIIVVTMTIYFFTGRLLGKFIYHYRHKA